MYEQRTTWMVYDEMPFPKMQQRIETIAGFFVTVALFFIAMAAFPTETSEEKRIFPTPWRRAWWKMDYTANANLDCFVLAL